MFVRRNDTSFNFFFILPFGFPISVSSLYGDRLIFNRAINFGQSLKYTDRKKRVYVNALSQNLHYSRWRTNNLSFTQSFSLSRSLCHFHIQCSTFLFILSLSSRGHIKKALDASQWKMKTGLIQFLPAVANGSAANIVQSNNLQLR